MCAQRLGNTSGRWHEEKVFDYLTANLPDSYRLLTSRVIPRNKSNYREFDLIILGKYAVYVVEIKHVRAAEIRGDAETWRWDSYLPSAGDYSIESPLKQVNEQWKILGNQFRAAHVAAPVYDLVCIYGDEPVELRINDSADRLEKVCWYKDLPAYFEKQDASAAAKHASDISDFYLRIIELIDTNFESHRLEQRAGFEIEDPAWETPLYKAYYAHKINSGEEANKRVLLKIYRRDLASDQNLLKFLARLQERNLAALEQLKNGQPPTGGESFVFVNPIGYERDQDEYLTYSEWVEGQPLSYIFKKASLLFKYRVTVAAQICRGLAYLHSAQVFHRDLTPDNILWDLAEKRVRIINLDFAKLPGGGTLLNAQTAPLLRLEVAGDKRKYQAPELRSVSQAVLQIPFEDLYHNANARTDIYSLGVILLELFTGSLKVGESIPGRLGDLAALDERIRDIIQRYCSEIPEVRLEIPLVEAAETFERIANNVSPTQDLFHLQPGDSLGFYEVENILHGGDKNVPSLSVVYLARDISRANQKVVIKVQKNKLWGSKIPDELWKSIQILEEIDSQYTARLLATQKAYIYNNKVLLQPVTGAQEAYYQIWEYIEGDDLEAYIKSLAPYKPAEASIDAIRERFWLGLGALKALSALHRKKWIHQDVKPKNFMRTPEGQIKIIDFGLSKRESESLNARGGTPCYIPPEATAKNEWTLRGDVWACGCMLVHVLCGSEVCSKRDIEEQIQRHRNETALGIEVIRVLEKATREDPEDRYPSAVEFLQDFEFAFDDWKTKSTRKNEAKTPVWESDMNDDLILKKMRAIAGEKDAMGDIEAWGEIIEDISAYETWVAGHKKGPCPIDLKKYDLDNLPPSKSARPSPKVVKDIISVLKPETPLVQEPPVVEIRAEQLAPASQPDVVEESPLVSDSDLSRAAEEQAGAHETALRRDLGEVRTHLQNHKWHEAVGLANSIEKQAHELALKSAAHDLLEQAQHGLTAALQEAIKMGDQERAAGELEKARLHYQEALALEENNHARRAIQELDGLFQAQLSEARQNALRAGLKERKDIHRLGEAVYEAEALDGEGKLPAELADLMKVARADYDSLRKAHGEETTQMRFGDLQARSDAVAKLRERVATGEKLIYDATINVEKPAFDLLREANALLQQASEDAAQYELNIAEKNKDVRPVVARERLEKALLQPFSEQYLRKLQEKLDEINSFVRAQEKAEELQRQAGLESDDLKKFALLLQAAQTFRNLPGLEEQTAQVRQIALVTLQAAVTDRLLLAEQAVRSQDYARARQETQQAEAALSAWPEAARPEEMASWQVQIKALRQRIDEVESAWKEYQSLSAAIRQQVSDPNRRAAALDLFRKISEDPRFDFPDRRILTSEIDQYKGVGEQLNDAQSAKNNGDWSRVFDIADKVLKSGQAGALAGEFSELYADAVTELNISRAQELLNGDDVFEANNILTATLGKEERERGKPRREMLEKRLAEEISAIKQAIKAGREMQALFDQAADALGLRDLTLFRLYTRPAAALRLAKIGADGTVSSPELRAEINHLKKAEESADPAPQELMRRAEAFLLDSLAKKGISERLRALKLFRHVGGDHTQAVSGDLPSYNLSLVTAEARRAARLVSESLRRDVFAPLKQKSTQAQGKEDELDDQTLRDLAYQALGLREAALLQTESERAVGRWAEVEWGKRQAQMEESSQNWDGAVGLWKDLDNHHPGLPEVQRGLRNARIQAAIQQARLLAGDHQGVEALQILKTLQAESGYSSSLELHLALADLFAGQGHFDEAFGSLDLAAPLAQDDSQRLSLAEYRAMLEVRKITDGVRAEVEAENLRELRPAEALRLLKNAISSLEARRAALNAVSLAASEAEKALASLRELSQTIYARAEDALLRKSQEQQAAGSNEGKIQAVVALVDLQTLEELAETPDDERRSTNGLEHLRDDLARVAEELVRIARDFEPASLSLKEAIARAGELTNRLQTFDNVMPLFTAQLSPVREKLSTSRHEISQTLENLTGLEKMLEKAQTQPLWDDALKNGNFQPLDQYKTSIDKLELGGIPEVAAYKNRLAEMQEIYTQILETIQAIKRAFSVAEDFEEVRRQTRASLTQPSTRKNGQPWRAVQQKEYETIRVLLGERLRVTDLYGEGDLVGWEDVETAADERYGELEHWRTWDKQCAYKMDAAWQALQITSTHSAETPHRLKRANWVKVQEAATATLQMLQSGPQNQAAELVSDSETALANTDKNRLPARSKAARDLQKEGKTRASTAEQWLHDAETQILVLDNILTDQGFPTEKEFADAASQKDVARLESLLTRAAKAGTVDETERRRLLMYEATKKRLLNEKSQRRWWNLG